MIFVMNFETLQHGILANKGASPLGTKSALYQNKRNMWFLDEVISIINLNHAIIGVTE